MANLSILTSPSDHLQQSCCLHPSLDSRSPQTPAVAPATECCRLSTSTLLRDQASRSPALSRRPQPAGVATTCMWPLSRVLPSPGVAPDTVAGQQEPCLTPSRDCRSRAIVGSRELRCLLPHRALPCCHTGTARRRPRSAVPGSLPRHGGTARHGTTSTRAA